MFLFARRPAVEVVYILHEDCDQGGFRPAQCDSFDILNTTLCTLVRAFYLRLFILGDLNGIVGSMSRLVLSDCVHGDSNLRLFAFLIRSNIKANRSGWA